MDTLSHILKPRWARRHRGFCVLLLLMAGFVSAQQVPLCWDDRPLTAEVLHGSFMGGDRRDRAGDRAPDTLAVIWRHALGSGITNVSTRLGDRLWSGCGWTGQPLLVREKNRLYLIQGAFDHNLKKIDAETGALVWQYAFDDVIKGTGTLWQDPVDPDDVSRWLILQGSRRGYGNNLGSAQVPSLRAVGYLDGKESWRLDVRRTPSISRDVDGSPVVLGYTVYAGLENGLLTLFPVLTDSVDSQGFYHPPIQREHRLYTATDVRCHAGNIVTESSPLRLGNRLYITAGSGHVYGYDIPQDTLDWDFFIGSDMDGSPVPTADGCFLVAVEKQFIAGQGGVYKLDPRLPPDKAVQWYFPTGNSTFATWLGGIIGSAGVNHATKPSLYYPELAAVVGIDGMLYVLATGQIDSTRGLVDGPNIKRRHPAPCCVFSRRVGPSIATPVFAGDKLIVAGYGGIYLFRYDPSGAFTLLDHFAGRAFEATPIAYRGRIYVGSRDGFLYCLGDAPPKPEDSP